MDQETAKYILRNDPEFIALWRRFNMLGVARFITIVAAIIGVIISSVAGDEMTTIIVVSFSALIVVFLEVGRATTKAKQQTRAYQLGVMP